LKTDPYNQPAPPQDNGSHPVGKPSSPRSGTTSPKAAAATHAAHLTHARQHLERIRQGVTALGDPKRVYLGHEHGDFFWELIGFRLVGHPSLIFGAVPFRRRDLPGIEYGRESLATYLSTPPAAGWGDRMMAPPGAIPVILPRAYDTIPSFLQGLRGGRSTESVSVDPGRIEVAFDLRLHSPAAVASLQRQAGPLRPHLIRTVEGHVLRGMSHHPGDAPGQPGSFVAMRDTEQLTPRGRYRLPNLALHRSFLGVTADVGAKDRRLTSAHWVPFLESSANPRHLLLS
jgi:hypothetical protein